jgi:NAD(P)-dependent dehydrogenase (short-subunit alcohol dehydrogenase family)
MQLSPNGFKSVVDIDLLGSFNTVRLAHRHLNRGKANIIAISAPQAFIPMAYQVHVCAAKAGVEMLTRVLALELGPEHIRVNAIVPGPIEGTEGMDRLAPTPEAREKARKSVPMQRYGTPREVADCAMFLASPLAAYISGAIIPVDGGWSVAGAGAGGGLDLKTS